MTDLTPIVAGAAVGCVLIILGGAVAAQIQRATPWQEFNELPFTPTPINHRVGRVRVTRHACPMYAELLAVLLLPLAVLIDNHTTERRHLMSTFSGRQYKGAMRDHRTDRYRAAVGRQILMVERGWCYNLPPHLRPLIVGAMGEFVYHPAPVSEFLRRGHTGDPAVDNVDYRSYVAAPAEVEPELVGAVA